MKHVGAQLSGVTYGECKISLPYSDFVTQQQGGYHGGIIGALADIAGGYAALTTVEEGKEVMTVEYKVNFLASCKGGQLVATGKVVKRGKRLVVTTAEVHHMDEEKSITLCAVMQQTIIPVVKHF